MKRILTIPLLFLYLIAASGVMIQLHYCGQELESWKMYAENDGCNDDSCGDESEENDGCCKDEVVVAKINQEQNTAQQWVLKLLSAPADLPQPFHACSECVELHTAATLQYSPNAPPGLWQNRALYQLHSSLTYYG